MDKPSTNLLQDRPALKLYACHQHLERLRSIKRAEGTVLGESRVQSEIEIDEFLYNIISAKDSLLQEIRLKFLQSMGEGEVDSERINDALNSIGKSEIMVELNLISKPSNFLYQVNLLHNQSKHQSMTRKHIVRVVGNGEGDKDYLYDAHTRQPMKVEILPFLEECLDRMTKVVRRTRERIDKAAT